MNKESFVFYESVAKQGERLENKLGKETAYDFYKAVIDFGLYGVLPEEDNDVWLYGFEQTITSITAAKDRYAAAVENGKKGGRPKQVDNEKVLELKQKGLTNKQVAAELNCSESTIEKINTKNRKTCQESVKTVKTRKNLNDNVNVNDNINENANVNFNLTGGKIPASLKELEPDDKEFYDFSKRCGIEKEKLNEEEASKQAWEQTIDNIKFLNHLN